MKIDNLPNDINELKSLFIKEIEAKDKRISQRQDLITILQRSKFAP